MSTAVTDTHHPEGGPVPPKATVRQWLGLTIMVVPLFMLATDVTALYLAMPAISADLKPTGSQSLWILHIGEFLTAATLITFGLLTRRIGARRLLLGAVAAYGLASLTAAFAADAEMLIVARAVLGVGAAAFTPAGLVMIRNTFQDERQYGIAFALFMAAFSGGMAAGPPFGGFILEHLWWGAVFLINVPIAVVLLLGGPLLLPRNHADRTVRIDLASVLLSVAAILALVYGMQEIAASGPAPVAAASAVFGMILVLVFLRRQARTAHPLLDLSLFRSRVFSVLLVILFLLMLGTMFVDMLMAQHLQTVRGLSPWEAGLVLLAPAVAATVGTAAAPLADRGGRAAGGLLLGIAGAAGLLLALRLPESGVIELAALLAVTMLLVAPYVTLLSQRLIGAAPMEKTGPATALQEVAASLGAASSIALMGAGALWIHRRVLRSAAPGSLDADVVDAAAESFGAAPAAAVGLDAPEAEALLHAADVGLTAATQTGYLVFSLVILVAAGGLMLFGRRIRG